MVNCISYQKVSIDYYAMILFPTAGARYHIKEEKISSNSLLEMMTKFTLLRRKIPHLALIVLHYAVVEQRTVA